jgi:hypothetical protein
MPSRAAERAGRSAALVVVAQELDALAVGRAEVAIHAVGVGRTALEALAFPDTAVGGAVNRAISTDVAS